MTYQLTIASSLAEVDAADWHQLGDADYPFTRYEFLHGLEIHHCLNEFGWQPVYFLIHENQQLLAACPSYIKFNGYGELVFDHAWGQAYERAGGRYYPKLVTAIPYTPATGQRFLIHHDADEQLQTQLLDTLVAAIQQFVDKQKLSSWHILFERDQQLQNLHKHSIRQRYDCQFHWNNHQYNDFDEFLGNLSSRKRKNIRKERASVASEALSVEQHFGDELKAEEWSKVHQLYAGIFDRKYGTPTLTRSFFQSLGQSMGKRTLVVTARDNGEIIAASLFFVSSDCLYGRVWGCDAHYNHLHFECCYYQGIDFCIKNGIQRFDPGAQGEHKISRGFLPTRTTSGHWFPNTDFQQMVERFLLQEKPLIEEYCNELKTKSPYKQT